jgi:hypothetical protein
VNTPSVALSNAVKNEPVEVAFVNDAERAVKRSEKKVDEVALVMETFVAKKLVEVADVKVGVSENV